MSTSGGANSADRANHSPHEMDIEFCVRVAIAICIAGCFAYGVANDNFRE